MVNWIRGLLTPPYFEDQETMRVVRVLNFSLWVMIAGGAIFALATPLVMPERINRMPITFAMVALIGFMLYLLRARRVRLVALSFTSSLWLLFSYAAITSGGIERPGFTLQILVVVIAALTLGGRIALAFAGLSGLFGLGMFIAQQAGKLPSESTYSLTASATTQLIAMFAIALLLHQAARSINEALARSQQSEQMLAERNRLLESEVAERKRVEAELRESQTRLTEAQLIANIGAWESDLQTGNEIWSDETRRHLGFDQNDIAPTFDLFLSHVHPDDRTIVERKSGETFSEVPTRSTQYRVVLPDGGLRYIASRASVQFDADGRPVKLLGITQDITERKQAEQQRFELAVEKERVSLLKEFIGNMSHDLKTPLTVIKTSLYLFERVADPERQHSKMETIKQQVLLLEKLIEDILTMSQLDHTPELTLASVDLNGLLVDVEHKLRPAAEEKRLSTRLELDASIPSVMASESELYRVMVNLLENAIKYTPEKGSVAIRTHLDHTMVVTEVTDTGIGISQEDMPRIFDRFFRANEARSIDIPGTGLGLSIVKRIVDMHNGSIEVDSTPGKGSVFRVLLPVHTQAAIPAAP
jgi:PAS domain S-box-containing protein